MADKATGQEQEAKQVLAELDKLDATDERFEPLLTRFIADAREHVEFEENHAWPLLRTRITEQEARDLGEKLEKGKDLAPTRPHPHTPPDEGVLKTTGPVAAAADRLRDAVTGRGQK